MQKILKIRKQDTKGIITFTYYLIDRKFFPRIHKESPNSTFESDSENKQEI